MKLPIGLIVRLSEILKVFLDYLVDKNDIGVNKTTLKRILKVSKLKKKEHIYSVIDVFITKRKIQIYEIKTITIKNTSIYIY